MYTLDEIIHLTGIPANKAAQVCRLLCNEGYLSYNESSGLYNLTTDGSLLSRIKKVREQLLKDDAETQELYNKIEDVITLGKPLALSEKELDKTVKDIGIPGLNIIFGLPEPSTGSRGENGRTGKTPGLPRGHCILIKGAPGTGKTTMGMQIAVHLKEYRALFLTFEEDINQLYHNLEAYCKKNPGKDNPNNNSWKGWDRSLIKKITKSITKIQTPSAWEDIDVVLQELLSILDKEHPRLIVVDSVSRLRDLGGDTKARQVFRRLTRALKIRGITSIFLGEDYREDNSFEDYEVDGVIRLEWEGDQLTLKVSKLRGLKAYKGPHSAALLTTEDIEEIPGHKLISDRQHHQKHLPYYLKPGINVFPEISIYKDFDKKPEDIPPKKSNEKKKAMSTGVKGLDELLEFDSSSYEPSKGFKKGETILVIGSAGAGKTLLALSFMKAGLGIPGEGERPKGKKTDVAVWVNLEGDIGTLRFAVDGFVGTQKEGFENLFPPKGRSEHNYFKFIEFPPIKLDLNKIVYTLAAIHEKFNIDRLVIDSITELEKAKGGGQPEVKSFLAGLIQFLRNRNITTIFISRSDTFFRSIDKIDEQISSLVDLIICIRNFDMHNQINKGVYIQKARGRKHDSRIMRMSIDSSEGIKIEASGWDVENLLAGDASYIQGPRVFFKLFYENPAEGEVNESIIKDFDKTRYPYNEPIFSVVRKTSIHTEFWSFRGQYSAGHANTRVLSIADHVISAFRDNNRLAELKYYVKNELIQNIKRDKQLPRLYNPPEDVSSPDEYTIDAIPCYRDYGVMVYKPFYKKTKNGEKRHSNFLDNYLSQTTRMNEKDYEETIWLPERFNELKKNSKNYTWGNLIEWINTLNDPTEEKAMKKMDRVPFAFPPLENKSEFIAFFMELLWSHGGDIYHFSIEKGYGKVGFRIDLKEKIKKNIINDLKDCQVYLEGLGNPLDKEQDGKEKILIEEEKKQKASIINILFNTHLIEDDAFNIYQQIKNRFIGYGIGQGFVEFDELMKWVQSTIATIPNDDSDGVLNLEDVSFKETIRLIMRLIHEAKVRNPIDGDFRKQAILSRHWYSHLHETQPVSHHLLPMPLAENIIDETDKKRVYYRSVTCVTYWSLVMLKNALSPEIGGNFIESMNAPEYNEKRLKMRAGMPYMNWQLDKERYIQFDPGSYNILSRVVSNGIKLEKLFMETSIKAKRHSKNEKGLITEEMTEYEEFRKNGFETLLEANDHAFVDKKTLEDIFDEQKIKSYLKDNENFYKLHNRMFYTKTRQTRVHFYQIEQALHFQLRQILIPDKDKEDVAFLGDVYKELKDLFTPDPKKNEEAEKNQKEKKEDINKTPTWDDVIYKITNELRLHLVLELLIYFYHQEKK